MRQIVSRRLARTTPPCLVVLTFLSGAQGVAAQDPVVDEAADDQDVQESPAFVFSPPHAFKTGLGAMRLTPFGDDQLRASASRFPSARIFITSQTTPTVGLFAGGLRLAPERVRGTDGAGIELLEDLALTAGVGGLRFNVTKGRIRAAPYLEVGVGRLLAQVDSGGYTTPQSYVPDLYEISGVMFGGGGGLGLDVIVGPGLTLSGLAGYSYFLSPNDVTTPIRGMFLGAGLSWTFKSNKWYWRTSGRDERPPTVRVHSHAPTPSGVVDAGTTVVGLELVASDLSGIDSVRIGTQNMYLDEAPEEARASDPEEGESSLATALLTLDQGPNYFDVLAWDGAGNQAIVPLRILGLPLDETPPSVSVFSPEDGDDLLEGFVEVTGVASDEVDVRRVEVNGLRARLEPAGEADRSRAGVPDGHVAYRFTANAPVDEGRNAFRVVATDTMSNEGVFDRFANGPTPDDVRSAPTIDILSPTEWAASDGTRGIGVVRRSSVRIGGMVRYELGIEEIRVDGRPATMEFNANGTVVNFEGFVHMEDRPRQVMIRAQGVDGSVARRTFPIEPRVRAGNGTNPIAETDERQRWAIVIGVSEYLDERIPDLDYADDDARAFYEFLRSPASGLGGVPEENIQFLIDEDASERQIRTALQTFLRRSTEDDIIMVYIAAHGMPDPQRPDDLYLIAHDTDLDNLPVTGIDMRLVQTAVNEAFAYNKIVFTDACHSAGVGGSTRVGFDANRINEVFLNRMSTSTGGLVMFTASETNQLSQEHERWGGGHGAFTYYLLQGLQGEADENGDGIVELGEVMEFTRDRVRRDTENAQVPSISQTQYDRFWPLAVVSQEGGSDEGLDVP